MGRVSYYLYGSSARGDKNRDSDLDVLAVCDDPKNADREQLSTGAFRLSPFRPIDLSVYGICRLREMYLKGNLFAWHLYRESLFLEGDVDLLAELGKPAVYTGFREDATHLFSLLESVCEQIEIAPYNLVYEAGIVYVCVRNIAMAASYFRKDGPNFSPYAPFDDGPGGFQFPLSRVEYDCLRTARLSGTRGCAAPELDAARFRYTVEKLLAWASNIIDIEEKHYEAPVC